jgi:D-tyrosyl-tRNA(Tyr) deacylase
MRVVVQRVRSASVEVAGDRVASIGAGLVVLAGVAIDDTPEAVDRVAAKVAGLRVFDDEQGRMNRSPLEASAEVLCISQFTLLGDVRRGRRPSYERAAPGMAAQPLFERFCEAIERAGLPCARGVFGAEMAVSLVNDGPVTLVIDSNDLEQPRRA